MTINDEERAVEIIDGETFAVTKFKANLKTGEGTLFDGQPWLDNNGLEFLPDRVAFIWSRKDGVCQVVVAAIGGDGVRRDGQRSRVRRWHRWPGEDLGTAPQWLCAAAAAGPEGVYGSLRGLM